MSEVLQFNPTSTLEMQIRCVRREIGVRERVYPGLVGNGRMTQARADAEIREMKSVLETLKAVQNHAPSLYRALRSFDAIIEGRPIDEAPPDF